MRDFISGLLDNWLGRIFFVILVSLLIIFLYNGWFFLTHKCVAFHVETQYQQPLSVVVGGNKSGGGIAVPMGNLKPVNVVVCDKYE